MSTSPKATQEDGAHSGISTDSEVLPVFPPELERNIFLLTVQTYRGASIRLMLVASRVKSWIEPYVYKTVLLHRPKYAVQFLDALTNYRTPEFTYSHVKALCIRPTIPLRLTIQLLTTCSGVESLALWISPQSDTAQLINLLSSLPLTCLSLNLASILPLSYPEAILHNHPVFIKLTHLDLVNNWAIWTSSLGIERLPRLTHVAFRFWSRGSIYGALSKILRESPNLQVLVLLTNAVVLPGASEYLERQGIRDTRIVVLQHGRDATEWESMEKGFMDMWQRAGIVVRWRKRNQAGPFDYPIGFSFGSADCDAFGFSSL